MAVPSIIQALREATGAAHERLDAAMRIEDRASDPTARRQMVKAFRTFHAVAEARMGPALAGVAHAHVSQTSRLPRLDADLRALGVVPSADPPIGPALPFAEALGWLYVVEGSSLGGHVILRTLANTGVDELGLSFLDPYGARVGARWRETMAVLDREVASGRADQADVLDGALAAFDFAYAVLTPPAE